MKRETSTRQRPLFHDGPVWRQLDESLQQQLIQRLAGICHGIVASVLSSNDQPLTDQQEEPNDQRD